MYKLNTYLDYFIGREDFVAVQGLDYYYPIQNKLDDRIVSDHIEGIETFGLYVLNKQSQCNLICIDIDIEKAELSNVDITDTHSKYKYLKDKLLKFKNILENELFASNNILYEESGGRGYHIWVFFEIPIDGSKALYINEVIKTKIDFTYEYFPKQPSLNEKRKYGNLIKLPLGEHKKYNRRSRFFTLKDDRIQIIEDIDSNLDHLKEIVKVESKRVDEIINTYKSKISYNSESLVKEVYESTERQIYKRDFSKLYSQCEAIKSLKDRALDSKALTHIEIFHLSNTLLSVKDSNNDIHNLLKSSLKEKYSFEITEQELKKIAGLRPANCGTLIKHGICKGYCKEEFKNKNEDQFLKNTSPLHSLNLISFSKKTKVTTNLLDDISKIENLKLAYYRLKEYHKNEDALFFDEFDFDFFEKDFDNNIGQLSIVIKNKIEIPLTIYEKVNIPKKLDENGKMVFRQMAYFSVFDQIIIQAIFNVIGEVFESHFEDNSYGYRLNVNDKSNKIFEDWREKYPEFRNTVLGKLREPNIKYYICCDIKGYYDNIRKDILTSQVRSLIDDDHIFNLITRTINAYSFSTESIDVGIPQGPAYARALANLYLNKFDKEIKERANYYFRYVDDFFILFDDYDSAIETKEWVVNRLSEFGLKLADGEEKEANIIQANDESILQNKIDSVRYGLFEDFKFLPNLNKHHIESFYNTIISKTYQANDKNKEIPTLIYFGTSSYIDNQKKNLIIDIVEELAKENTFFPKKVKTLFLRLLEIYESLGRNFLPFFDLLDDTNKTYFLLSVYQKYKENNLKYSEKLSQLLKASLSSEDKFFLGFGLRISSSNPDLVSIMVDNEFVTKINSINSVFLSTKFYKSINYFDYSAPIQRSIDNYFKTGTYYLIKKGLFVGISSPGTIKEVDNELFNRILSGNCYLLHSDCCRLISLMKSKNAILDTFVNFIETEKPRYTTFIPELLGNKILLEYKESDDRDLDNLKLLYSDKGLEIRNIIDQSIDRIRKIYRTSSQSYTTDYNRIDKFNNCFYYVACDNNGVFREIIPFLGAEWMVDFKSHLEALQEKSIFPKTEIQYDSGQSIVVLTSFLPNSAKDITDFSFSLNNDQECYSLICLANNIYKKAFQYFKITGKIPLIDKNIKIIGPNFDVLFIKKGKDLSSQYFCNNELIDSGSNENILKLLHKFLCDILFLTNTELKEFTASTTPKIGVLLFINYIVQRLKNEKISVEKFDYLTNLLEKNRDNVTYAFFSEKMKLNIYKNCENYINWKGITNGILELYADFAVTYKKIDFSKVKYRYNLLLNNDYPTSLHPLSKIIINFNTNLGNLLPEYNDDFYQNYFHFLNIFGVYCLEIHRLFKLILAKSKEIEALTSQHKFFEYDGKQIILSEHDIQNINRLIKVYNSKSPDNSVFKNSSLYTLREMGFLCLLVNYNLIREIDHIIIQKSNNNKDKILAKILLNTNSDIEEAVYHIVNLANDSLKNHYWHPDITKKELFDISDNMVDALFLIDKTLMKFGIRRASAKFHLSLDTKKFELIKWLKHSSVEISVMKSNNNPFTDEKYNFEKEGKLYYESIKGFIYNIIIPDKRIITLHENLKKGKLFGYKFSFFYFKKGLLIWDLIFTIILGASYAYLFTIESKGFKLGLLELLKKVWWIPSGFFLGKSFFDLKYWIMGFENFVSHFRHSD